MHERRSDMYPFAMTPVPKRGPSRRTVIKAGAAVVATTAVAGGVGWWMFNRINEGEVDETQLPIPIAACDTWGARSPTTFIRIFDKKATKILVHHTDTINTEDYSQARAYSLSRSIQRLHMDNNGWGDTGQHFTVSRGGFMMEGRHRSLEALVSGEKFVRSAHCPQLNEEAIGIENEGNYVADVPPEALWNSLVDLCVYICQQYAFGANAIFTHWDFTNTSCPGIKFYEKLPLLRQQVAKRLAQPITGRTWPDLRPGVSGAGVRALQYLLLAQGADLDISGKFDANTERLLKGFQGAKRIQEDAYTYSDTWEALLIPLATLDNTNANHAAQVILKRNGAQITLDGHADATTREAIRATQKRHSLAQTGELNLDTWCVLLGGVAAHST